MQIMTLLGSPRKGGNTSTMLNWVEERLKADGHEIDRADIIDYRVDGCQECWSCRTTEVDLCNVKDDANELFDRMIHADAVLLASPVFCWGFPSQIKPLIDRMFCLVSDFQSDPEYATKIQGKPMALLVTSGGPEENDAEFVIRAYENLVRFFKAKYCGNLLIPFCTKPEDLDEEAKEKAAAFAQKMTADINAALSNP